MDIIILVLIGICVFIIIRKKVKDIKNGKFCNCGCQECPSHEKCEGKKKV